MSITSYEKVRCGNVTTVTATSSLSGTVWYHWYIDGCYVATTTNDSYSFFLDADDQARIEVLDTNDPNFDPIANAPSGYPARRTIYWNRSTDSDVDHYLVQQSKDGAAFSTIGKIYQDANTWEFSILTPRLTDLSTYDWQVVPVDAAGNEGTALEYTSEKIVRTPDAPDFEISFDNDTSKVTFSSA